MNHDRNLQLLGIAKKAGLLAIGGDAVGSVARTGKARLVISASDASPGAFRRARYATETSSTIFIIVPYTKFELGNVTGRGSPGTVAFLDVGLAAKFVKGLAEMQPERYGETAKQLTEKAVALAEKKKPIPNKRRTAQ
jgi:ribosomal protein L7Ae-like RNA K-turn-binding protein